MMPARAMARAMVAEMHSGYQSLRKEMPMNIRRRVETGRRFGPDRHEYRAHPHPVGRSARAPRQ